MKIESYQSANIAGAKPGGMQGNAGMLAKARSKQSLSQRLGQFSDQLFNLAGKGAQAQGAKDAVVDVAKRKAKVREINADEFMDADEKTEAISKLTEGTASKGFGIYSRAYDSAASAAYSSQVKSDAKSAYDLAMIEAKGDPAAFMEMYTKFSSETIKGAPTESTKIVAQETTMNYGTAGLRALSLSKSKNNTAANKAKYKDSNIAMSQLYSNAYKKGDVIEQSRVMSEIFVSGSAAVRDGYISQAEHDVNMIAITQNAVVDNEVAKFGEFVSSGRGQIGYDKFVNAQKEGAFDMSDPEEIAKLKSSMLKQVKEYNDAQFIQDDKEKKLYDVTTTATYREGVVLLNKGELTESMIQSWLTSSSITQTDADNLRETLSLGQGRKYSDAATVASYAYPKVLLESSPKDIYSDVNLSYADRGRLAAQRESMLKGAYNWRGTNNGKMATSEIKGLFGVIEGTLMAQIDLSNQTMKDFNNMMSTFYDEVSAIGDPLEQETKSLTIGRRLITEYNKSLDDKKAANTAKRLANEKEEATKSASAYNDSIFVSIGWRDPVTWEDMMLED